MIHNTTPNTTPETGTRISENATGAMATQLAKDVPGNIVAVLEIEQLQADAQAAINYINARVRILQEIPRANRESWLQRNPEFLKWLTSFPRTGSN